MTTQYKTLVDEWFEEVWNKRDTEAIDRLLAPDARIHGLLNEKGEPVQGPEEFKRFHAVQLAAFPNLRVDVLETVSEGNMVALRCVVRGRHEGDSLGFPATHKDVEFAGMCMARVENGKVVETWNSWDFLGLHMQMDSLKLLLTPALSSRHG